MSSEQRAALVDDAAWTIRDLTEDGSDPRVISEAVIAKVEAAGGWPRPEAVTAEEVADIAWRAALPMNLTDDARDLVVREILAALPDRHRAIVLGSRGITVEGAK